MIFTHGCTGLVLYGQVRTSGNSGGAGEKLTRTSECRKAKHDVTQLHLPGFARGTRFHPPIYRGWLTQGYPFVFPREGYLGGLPKEGKIIWDFGVRIYLSGLPCRLISIHGPRDGAREKSVRKTQISSSGFRGWVNAAGFFGLPGVRVRGLKYRCLPLLFFIGDRSGFPPLSQRRVRLIMLSFFGNWEPRRGGGGVFGQVGRGSLHKGLQQ